MAHEGHQGTGREESVASKSDAQTRPSRVAWRFSLTPRARVILLLAPAVLLMTVLLGRWGLRIIGIGLPKYAPVDLKALGNFTFDEVKGRAQDIPRVWRDLDGRRVEMEGFLLHPRASTSGHLTYQLVYNVNSPSGYPRASLVQEHVDATVPASTREYDEYDSVCALGVMHVGVQRDGTGRVSSVFRMDVESVTDIENAPTGSQPTTETWIALLISYLFVVFIVMVKEWPWRDLPGRRARAGLCPSCGYDLRVSNGRCPECGAMISGGLVSTMRHR